MEINITEDTKEIKNDGEEWFHLEPWYKFVNPFEHLKGYKIMYI